MPDENLIQRSKNHAPPPAPPLKSALTLDGAPPPASPPPREARAESALERAERRAAELQDHSGDLTETNHQDNFYIDPSIVPEGWTYEWKRFKTLNAEDPSYQVALARKGWEAVPLNRHPEFMPKDWKGAIIEKDGMVLMELPTSIYMKFVNRDKAEARRLRGDKEAQLNGTKPGHFERDNKGQSLVKLSREYEALAVPKD